MVANVNKRQILLKQLGIAVDRVANKIQTSNRLLSADSSLSFSKNYVIKKNSLGLHNVYQNGALIFKNISLYTVASILVERLKEGKNSSIRQILELEGKYMKYQNDMIHYLHCLQSAKKNCDLDRIYILEDKFQIAEARAEYYKQRLISFRIVNYHVNDK